jgi:hypothetical protein
MWRTPSTVLTASSMNFVTSRSTVSGDAPVYRVVTVTTGKLDVWKEIDLERLVRRQTEDRQGGHHHRGEDRLLD